MSAQIYNRQKYWDIDIFFTSVIPSEEDIFLYM